MNGSVKQAAVRIGVQPARSAIDPDSHLWFALAVSLVLHSLFLTALAVKSRWSPVYHPAMYGMGSGFSVVQFVAGTSDGPAKDPGSKDDETVAPGAELSSSSSPRVEVSENPPLIEKEPVEQVAVQVSVSQEAHHAEDSAVILRPEPNAAGTASSVSPHIGGVADGTGTGVIGGESFNGVGSSGGRTESRGGGNSYGIPAYLSNPRPPYPRVAREHGWEGTTLLQVEVPDDGRAGRVEILESSGHEILDEAAVTTVRHWRFLPARSGDTPVPSLVEIPIHFRMAGNQHP